MIHGQWLQKDSFEPRRGWLNRLRSRIGLCINFEDVREEPGPLSLQKPVIVPLSRSLIHLTGWWSPMPMLILSLGYHVFSLYPLGHRWMISSCSSRWFSRCLIWSNICSFSWLWQSSLILMVMTNDLQIPRRVTESVEVLHPNVRLVQDDKGEYLKR